MKYLHRVFIVYSIKPPPSEGKNNGWRTPFTVGYMYFCFCVAIPRSQRGQHKSPAAPEGPPAGRRHPCKPDTCYSCLEISSPILAGSRTSPGQQGGRGKRKGTQGDSSASYMLSSSGWVTPKLGRVSVKLNLNILTRILSKHSNKRHL